MKTTKKKYFLCPVCGVKHNIHKTKELAIVLIKCNCGADSAIQTRNGYHIPSRDGMKKVYK